MEWQLELGIHVMWVLILGVQLELLRSWHWRVVTELIYRCRRRGMMAAIAMAGRWVTTICRVTWSIAVRHLDRLNTTTRIVCVLLVRSCKVRGVVMIRECDEIEFVEKKVDVMV